MSEGKKARHMDSLQVPGRKKNQSEFIDVEIETPSAGNTPAPTPRDHEKGDTRKVEINLSKGDGERFCDNSIRTTKYTWYNFIFKNLFEQFRRVANLYFLLIAILQLVPGLTSLDPASSFLPLLAVMGVTMIKEGIEDLKRARSDTEINRTGCCAVSPVPGAVRQGDVAAGADDVADEPVDEGVRLQWQNLRVGDLVRICSDEAVPADVVVLQSSLPQGLCYVETANLDGETNLKIRQCPKETTELVTPENICEFRGTIECEQPNDHLYVFEGTLSIDGEAGKISLSNKQVLLRGCVLRNTEWVYGVVVFTGAETKLVQNSTAAPSKRSTLERRMNRALWQIFAFYFCLCCVGAIMSQVVNGDEHWYIHAGDPEKEFSGSAYGFFFNLGTVCILMAVMIPISLYVSMEMAKMVQASLINSDLTMYYEAKDQPAKAHTTNLCEELGQIEYIFSDKTGTLTCNDMAFSKFSVGGVSYDVNEPGDSVEVEGDPTHVVDLGSEKLKAILHGIKRGHKDANKDVDTFFLLLALCHTVIVQKLKDGSLNYQAASPDELALVEAAKAHGYELIDRQTNAVVLKVHGKEQTYQVLNINEFNSTRKRMSVVVRLPTGEIKLLVKGADSVVLKRLAKDTSKKLLHTSDLHLTHYGRTGLRTLMCASRDLSTSEYKKWNQLYHDASVALHDRSELMDKAAENIEQDMDFVGLTAIEDRLQDGVPDTIATLLRAGIRLWVLTGDKVETAINIGLSANLITRETSLLRVTKKSSVKSARRCLSKLIDDYLSAKKFDADLTRCLVVDGDSLALILGDSAAEHMFVLLGQYCKSVICCRVSPLQKSLVVRLIKDALAVRTLAVGDGANDVSMIQEAHVGIGISGNEGRQATMASDYAIGQFRFLRPLLLVHGRWNYRRTSKLVLYSFYKNIVFSLTQFWFLFYSLNSGQNFFDSWILIFYNLFFTALPILVYAALDQDCSRVFPEKLLPQLYEVGLYDHDFSAITLWTWIASGVVGSVVLFYMSMLVYGEAVLNADGNVSGLWTFGTIAYTGLVVVVTVQVAFEFHYWTWVHHAAIWISVAAWFLFAIIYNLLNTDWLPSTFFNVAFETLGSAYAWFGIVLVPSAVLSLEFTLRYIMSNYRPQNHAIVREIERVRGGPILTEEEIRNIAQQRGGRKPAELALSKQLQAWRNLLPGLKADDSDTDEDDSLPPKLSSFAFASEKGQADTLRIQGFYKPLLNPLKQLFGQGDEHDDDDDDNNKNNDGHKAHKKRKPTPAQSAIEAELAAIEDPDFDTPHTTRHHGKHHKSEHSPARRRSSEHKKKSKEKTKKPK